MSPDQPEPVGNRATRRAAARRTRKLAALGSGAVLATGVATGALAAFPSAAGAAPILVSNTNDSGSGSLRQALADANPGDTIDMTGISGTISLTTGELDIDDAVTITGPGSSLLTIDAQGASRVFLMNDDLQGGTVTISGVTITGGNPGTHKGGGGIKFYCDGGSGNLALSDAVVTGNTVDWLGGGLYFDNCDGSSLTIDNSVFSNNAGTDYGAGALWFDEGGTLTIRNSTLVDNRAKTVGGALYFDDGANLVVTNSTIAGNSAGIAGGGFFISRLDNDATIANSTFTGNTTGGVGGAVAIFDGTLTLEQTTVSGNTATDGGDGLYFGYFSKLASASGARAHQADESGVTAQDAQSPTISGSIVAGNGAGTSDLASGFDGALPATATSSVLGTADNVDVTGTGNQTGVTNPGLAPLANNGGPTQTMALLEGSPAIDAGPDPVADFPGNEFDQRGAGFARVVNGKVDVGAYEVQPAPSPAPEVVVTPKFTG